MAVQRLRYTAHHGEPVARHASPRPTLSFGTTCLAEPTSFPEHMEGIPWGCIDMQIELPGGPYIFLGLEATQAHWIRRVFAERATDLPAGTFTDLTATESVGGVVTRLFRAPRSAFLDFERVDWKILIDVDYLPSGLRLAAHQWMGQLRWNDELSGNTSNGGSTSDTGDLIGSNNFTGALWTPVTSGSAFTDLFENYFRIVVAYRLLVTGGLLLHSAGVADDSGGYVFPGASGNGKSTLSKISRREGRLVLSDDGNALGLEKDEEGRPRVWVEALPFGGEMRERPKPRGRFPLRRISALRKGPNNGLDSLSRAQATSLLLGCSPFVNGDPHQTSRLLETIDTLLSYVPTSTLTFTKAGGFWGLFNDAEAPS